MGDDICPRFDPTFSSLTNVFCSGVGACNGDFGGPMICLETMDGIMQPVIRGLMSHTSGCATKPTIFVNIEAYKPWIATSTRALVMIKSTNFREC